MMTMMIVKETDNVTRQIQHGKNMMMIMMVMMMMAMAMMMVMMMMVLMMMMMVMVMMVMVTWSPGMIVKAPSPKAMTSVMEVTVTEMPACRIV